MKWYKQKINFKILLYLFFIFVIIGLGIYSYFIFNKKGPIGTTINNFSLAGKASNKITDEKILIYEKNEDSNNIRLLNLNDSSTILVFSDSGEDYKIDRIEGYANLTGEILISVRENDHKILKLIRTDGKVIRDNINITSSYETASLSPDGQNIAFVVNTQNPRQSKIYEIGINNSNLRLLFQSTELISPLVWNSDLEKIYFISKDTKNKSKIISFDLNDISTSNIYETDAKISSLSYNGKDYIVFSEENDKNLNSGRVIAISTDGKNKGIILETNEFFPASPILSPNLDVLTFLETKFTDKFQEYSSGETSFIYINHPEIIKLRASNLIFGFVK